MKQSLLEQTTSEIRQTDVRFCTARSVFLRPCEQLCPCRYTYLGQFLSHDLNEDGTSTLGVPVDPATLPNFNTPAVDLDTLYSHNVSRPR